MNDFIIKLQDMLKLSGRKDWEIRYIPAKRTYILKLDGDTIFMKKLTKTEGEQ